MEYLDEFGFNENDIEEVYNTLSEDDLNEMIVKEDRVKEILKLLTDKGIINLKDIVLYRTNIFYLNPGTIKSALETKEGIVEKINEDIMNFELLEKEYSKLESQNIVSYDENNSFISSLDEKFGIENSKYIYKIGKQSISRLKVIRIYNALKSNNKFSEEDIKTFALLYGTYINPNTYKYVKDMIDNLEVNNGISRWVWI